MPTGRSTLRNDAKYIGLDVHQATISVAVLDSAGNLVMEAILETKAETILQFIHGLRGSLHVTWEEGTCAAWLHDLLKPYVTKVVVCDPTKNALLKAGNKSHRIDARKLADLLYLNKLHPVYHGETGIRALQEVARSYLAWTRDTTRVMNRLKALYRSWAIPCAGQRVYAPRDRSEWLAKISEAGVRRRAEIYYQQLDALRSLREQVRRDLLAEGRKHSAMNLLRQIPSIGPIRAVLLIALVQTPHRLEIVRTDFARRIYRPVQTSCELIPVICARMKLHTYGLLRNSFRPSQEIRRPRTYWRQRNDLVRAAGLWRRSTEGTPRCG